MPPGTQQANNPPSPYTHLYTFPRHKHSTYPSNIACVCVSYSFARVFQVCKKRLWGKIFIRFLMVASILEYRKQVTRELGNHVRSRSICLDQSHWLLVDQTEIFYCPLIAIFWKPQIPLVHALVDGWCALNVNFCRVWLAHVYGPVSKHARRVCPPASPCDSWMSPKNRPPNAMFEPRIQ